MTLRAPARPVLAPAATAWMGAAIMIGSEAATLDRIEPFFSWNTPIVWTGFILFADSVVFRARGSSWIRSAPGEFVALAVWSIPLWLVFELYNRRLANWYYIGLPQALPLRLFGYAWSFATIWPAVFEAAELVSVWRGAPGAPPSSEPDRAAGVSPRAAWPVDAAWIALGAAMLASPLLAPPDAARYLAPPVWLGFIALLDPLNRRLGGESLLDDWRRRRYDRTINFVAGGLLCGVLWEFWNYWAGAKWIYTVPILEQVKIFEMPLPGYLGFPAFALECFTMYVFVRLITARTVGQRPFRGRPIGW